VSGGRGGPHPRGRGVKEVEEVEEVEEEGRNSRCFAPLKHDSNVRESSSPAPTPASRRRYGRKDILARPGFEEEFKALLRVHHIDFDAAHFWG
jgi:hypothetical protein